MDEDAHLEAAYEERTDIGDDDFEFLYEDPEVEDDDVDFAALDDFMGDAVDDEGGMSEVRNQIRTDAMDPELTAAIWQRTEDDAEVWTTEGGPL